MKTDIRTKGEPGVSEAESVRQSAAADRSPHAPPTPVHDCWNTIGVNGNRSCCKLSSYAHCRNCPVYSAAALQLLDRPVSREYRREWTEHFAREKKIATAARMSVVVFRIGEEWLALPAKVFQEVAGGLAWPCASARADSRPTTSEARGDSRPTATEERGGFRPTVLHSLPHRRNGIVLGLVNVRGELLICVSLGRLLGISDSKVQSPKSKVGNASATSPEFRREDIDSRLGFGRLMVASWEGKRLAFPVDEVHGLHRLAREELRSSPATLGRRGSAVGAALPGSSAASPHQPSALPDLEAGRGHTEGIFSWRGESVGLLDAGAVFAGLNGGLS